MIIPYGHDKGIRRRPVVTLVIIVVCTLLQLQRFIAAPSEEQIAEKLAQRGELVARLLEEVAADVEERALAADPDGEQDPPDLQDHPDVKAILAGRFEDLDHPYVEEIQRLDAQVEELLAKDVALRFGWAPKDGFTLNLLLCAFVHAGWLHLLGNMLFLWLAGTAIEDRWGHATFAGFYAAGAVVAAGTYALWNPGSAIKVVGASGAVAACMGAFLVCYYRVKIRFFWWWYFRTGTFDARALYALPVWFLEEVVFSWFEAHGLQGVAHSAHVGGFVFGAGIAALLKYTGVERTHLMLLDELAEEWSARNPELEEAQRYERGGQKAPALVSYRKVLAREPAHPVARPQALVLALELGEHAVAAPLASGGISDLARDGRVHELPMVYKKLQAAGLHEQLSDRALADVARAALGLEPYTALGVEVVRQMLAAPAPSPLLPGLVWRVAEVQAAAGRADLAARALAMLVERFPMDPWADRARAKLREAAGRGEA